MRPVFKNTKLYYNLPFNLRCLDKGTDNSINGGLR